MTTKTKETDVDTFLPDDYDLPSSGGNYMKLADGDNVFRIMSRAIYGWEYWTEDEDGKHPNRVHEKAEVPKEMWHNGNHKPKHFWAFVVWNWAEERFQILQLTQKTIQKELKSIADRKSTL